MKSKSVEQPATPRLLPFHSGQTRNRFMPATILVVAVVVAIVPSRTAKAGQLAAGVAKVDITNTKRSRSMTRCMPKRWS